MMRNNLRKMFLAGLLLAASLPALGQYRLRVEMASPKKEVPARPVGVNLFMLMDDDRAADRARPMWRALRDLNVRSVRFNEGEYGDWYIFTHPDSLGLLTKPGAPLYPRLIDIKSRGIDSNLTDVDALPGYGGYPLNGKGYRPTIDFNAFLKLCRKAGVDEPTVIIPTLPVDWSKAKPFYPSRHDLVRLAAGMVHYANRVCDRPIRYWEIGNEHYWENRNDACDTVWAAQCASLVLEMARAMKAEDPTIEVGVNGFTAPWLETMLTYADDEGNRLIDYVDNIVPHQYAKAELIGDYALYRRSVEYPLHEVDEVVKFLARADAPDAMQRNRLKIQVTEASSFMPGQQAHLVDNVAWVSLANFEHLGYILAAPKVEFVDFWATHWTDDKTYWSALKMDNRLAPMGWGIKLWNDNLLSNLWKADLHSTDVRCYASTDSAGQRLVLFVVNRLDHAATCDVELAGYVADARFLTSGIWADRPEARDFRMQPLRKGHCDGQNLRLDLPPLSVTVVSLGE